LPADVHEFPGARPRVKKLRLALVLLGLGALAVVSTLFGMMMAVASELPNLETRAEFRSARNSVLVDYRGRNLGILRGPENRIIVPSDRISEAMKDAIIAVEDRRFYENEGVDLRAVARAFVQDVLAREARQGGSTIAQQLVKNATEAQDDRTIFTKVREAALAFHLTRRWSKDRILTEYLNSIYFGNGAYGIEAAAQTYFGRAPGHEGCVEERRCAATLRPAEAALIAGVVASPSGYDPVSRPAAAEARRNLVLRNMREQGRIDEATYREAIAEALPGEVTPPRERSRTAASPYFTTWVRQQVVERFGARRAFTGGLRVETTLDVDLQEAAEAAVQRWLPNPDGPTAALVAIDNDTGEVRAMVGGRDYNESPFNLATQGQRQPGSAFKPFILATALREGVGPGALLQSRRRTFEQCRGGAFEVNNYEDAYSGVTTLARATTFSDNSAYAELGLRVGLRDIARTARRMGVRTPISRNCAMTLGGLREGVTPLDMAHAYQTFATGGRFVTGTLADNRAPVGIREVCRMDGDDCDRIARNRRRTERVLPENVARTATQIMSTVVTQGTATAARLPEFAAGKTGTTENYGDAWFVGFTRRYTVAVWVGYPDRLRPMETEFRGEPVAGGTFPAHIWRDFMMGARQVREERVNAERQRRGLPPRDLDAEDAAQNPAATTPAAPAPAPEGEAPPSTQGGEGGDPTAPGSGARGGAAPEQPQEQPQRATPQPEPEAPEPQTPPPAPATPAPSSPPASGGGGTGAPPG